jgi:hypothetical protein
MPTTHNPTKIAALNDTARKSFSGCRVYMTPGVQALYQTQAIAARVQAYKDVCITGLDFGFSEV